MTSSNVTYENFRPTLDLKLFLDSELAKLDQLSPSDSVLKCHLTRHRKAWHAEIQINSSRGRFFSTQDGHSVAEVTIAALTHMHEQLQRWAVIKHQLPQRQVS